MTRNGATAASTLFVSRMMLRDPQHNRRSIAHYLPVVYYYLVGTSFETRTRSEWETPRPSLPLRG